MDEPTTGLDPQTRKKLWDVVENYRKTENMTVLLTTHYMEETADADYVIILDSGKISASGTPLELKNKYTGDFITVYNTDENIIKALGHPYEKIRDAFRISVKNTEEARDLIVKNPSVFNDFEITKGKMDDVFLAVTGKALGTDEKFFEVTIRLNPEYDPTVAGSRQYQTVNATQISRKTHKVTGNTTATGAATKTKVDLSTYTIVPYMSPHIGITSDQLVEETTEYFRNYNLNGITGSVTVFGDFGLTPAVQVELMDNRNPSKNGVYLVEEVTTTFGVGGYRQKLSIPYKIKSSKD